MSPLEKAAKAAYAASDMSDWETPPLPWESLRDTRKNYYLSIASAVLKAVEVPSEEMVSAGFNATQDAGPGDIEAAYTTMIRAALGEK